MASDDKDNYMECILRIDTSEGWEKSVTKVLTRFKDLAYEINPKVGFIYVKGKTDPQIILMNLKRGGKHASIHWISYGFPRDDPENYLGVLNGHSHLNWHDPFHQAIIDPYDPYYSWYNTDQQLGQNGLLHQRQFALEHEPRGNSERRSSSSSGSHSHHHHHHHCPLHSHHNHSPLMSSSQSRHSTTPAHNSSPPSIQPEASNDRARNQSVPKESYAKSIKKKIFGKLGLFRSKK